MPPKPKLTVAQIADIRARKAADQTITLGTFAEEFCVNESTISRILAAKDAPALAVGAYATLHASPLNPRKRFDPASLEDLAESIAKEGVLLPLLVRRANQPGNLSLPDAKPDDYEIIAGERRWRAVGRLIEQHAAGADYGVPIRLVDPCDDRKLLELALTENVARKDMTPLEEAEAFALLVDQGASPSEIGNVVGMTARTVQKRLRLVKDLTPQVREALATGEISVEQANVLAAYCPKSKQNGTVEEIKRGQISTTIHLKKIILSTRIPASGALFDVAQYQGDWIEDDDNPEIRYFADGAVFKTLQAKGLKAKKAELEAAYSWVEIFDRAKDEYFYKHRYQTISGHAKAGAIIELDERGAAIGIHVDLVREQDLATPKKSTLGGAVTAEPDPMDSFTKAHLVSCHQAKTQMLQAAVAKNFKAALALSLVGLLHGRDVHIKMENHDADDRVAHPDVLRSLEDWVEGVGSGLLEFGEGSGGTASTGYGPLRLKGSGYYTDNPQAQADLFRRLMSMPDADLQAFYSVVIAERVGTWSGFTPSFGDRVLPLAIAEDLSVKPASAWKMDEEWLKKLRKPALQRIAQDLHLAEGWQGLTASKLREEILVTLKDYPGYVPPTMEFGLPADIESKARDWVTGKTTKVEGPADLSDKEKFAETRFKEISHGGSHNQAAE